MILIVAILKIGLWSFILYRLNINSLILTCDRSLNNMIPLNESPGDILNHKSKLQKCIELKYVFFVIFLDAILKYCNLAIKNSFNIFLDLLNVILVVKIFFQID